MLGAVTSVFPERTLKPVYCNCVGIGKERSTNKQPVAKPDNSIKTHGWNILFSIDFWIIYLSL